MAETTETVVFEVDVSSYEKSLAEITKSINTLKTSQKDLQEQTKQGAEGAAESLEKVNAELKVQQQQYRTTQNVLVGYIGAKQKEVNVTDFAENSIQTNRDLLKQLTAQYINTKNPSEQFTKQIKTLSDTLKQQEGVIGDTRRNVGNYAESFKGAISSVIGGIPALKGFQTAQLGVNAAMNANPVGAVVFALQGLYEIFSQNAEVADQVSFAIDGVTKAIGSVVDGIVDTVTNFDKFTEALKNPIKFLFNLGKNAANAAAEGYNAAKAIDALSEASATANAVIEKNNVLIEKNVNILKTTTATIEERKKAAKEIAELERSNAQESIKIAQSELEAEQLKLKGKKLTGAESAKLITLQGKLDAATLQSQTINEGYNRRISQLLQKEGQERNNIANDTEKRLAEEQKQREDAFNAEKKLDERRIEFRKMSDDARKKAEADIISAQSKEFNDEVKFQQKQLELDLKYVDLSVATEEEKAKRKEEIQINSLERQLDLAIQFLGADGSITREELQGIETIKQAIQSAKQGLGKKKNEFGEGTLGGALGLDKESIDDISGRIQEVENVVSGIQDLVNTVSAARINTIENERNAEIQAVNDSVGSEEEKAEKIKAINAKANREKYEAERAAFESNKATSIILAIINTAQAVIAQFSNPTPYVGIVLAALAAATGAAQIAVIASQQPPPPPSKFADGGQVIPIGGRSHAQGGTPIHVNGHHVAEAEAGEGLFIMKKDAYRDINMLSGWNQKYGGRSWGNSTRFAADGGSISLPTSDGGFSTRQITDSVNNSLVLKQAIREGFAKAPAPELSIVELNTKQNSRSRSINISEL